MLTGNWLGDFIKLLAIFLVGLLQVFNAGCALNAEPIERTSNTLITEIIKPAVLKATEETVVQTAQLQGSGQLIDPGYEIEALGGLINGWYSKITIRVVGAAGQLQGAGQATQPGKVEDGDETAISNP